MVVVGGAIAGHNMYLKWMKVCEIELDDKMIFKGKSVMYLEF